MWRFVALFRRSWLGFWTSWTTQNRGWLTYFSLRRTKFSPTHLRRSWVFAVLPRLRIEPPSWAGKEGTPDYFVGFGQIDINWGDGDIWENVHWPWGGPFGLTQRAYRDLGPHTISINFESGNPALGDYYTQSASVTFEVRNAPPSVSFWRYSETEFSLSAEGSDPEDDVAVELNWGDGSSSKLSSILAREATPMDSTDCTVLKALPKSISSTNTSLPIVITA
jgi:hypothetical protein